jgi:phosphoglycolate phosphatase-like HAD superfamily hydrolase
MPARSLVLFDIDGTLLRGAGRHHKDALLEGIRRVTGHIVTLDGIDTSGQLDRDLIATLLQSCAVEAALEQIVAECQDAYLANCAADLSGFVCKGAREVLAELQMRGAILGLVTGNLSEIGWRKMELAGIRSFFSLGAFSEDGLTRAQLARMAAARAKERQLITDDCRISLIGDHQNDILAAKANGFRSVAVASGVMPIEQLRQFEPDILISSLSELDAGQLL